jgi:hypothetical protein
VKSGGRTAAFPLFSGVMVGSPLTITPSPYLIRREPQQQKP